MAAGRVPLTSKGPCDGADLYSAYFQMLLPGFISQMKSSPVRTRGRPSGENSVSGSTFLSAGGRE